MLCKVVICQSCLFIFVLVYYEISVKVVTKKNYNKNLLQEYDITDHFISNDVGVGVESQRVCTDFKHS